MKSRPRAVSRVSVSVVLFDRMSTSPDCRAVKRCCEESGTNLTFSASPKIAEAMARHTSTSRPTHLPWLSASMKPAVPVPTPQTSAPRALTASSTVPAVAAFAATMAARPMVVAIEILRMYVPFVRKPRRSLGPNRRAATAQTKTAALAGGGRWLLGRGAAAPQINESAARTGGHPGSTGRSGHGRSSAASPCPRCDRSFRRNCRPA